MEKEKQKEIEKEKEKEQGIAQPTTPRGLLEARMVEAEGLDKASLGVAVQQALLELTQQDKRTIETEKQKNLQL